MLESSQLVQIRNLSHGLKSNPYPSPPGCHPTLSLGERALRGYSPAIINTNNTLQADSASIANGNCKFCGSE